MARSRLAALVGLVLALLTVLAYARVCRNGFINLDDGQFVTENREVQQGLNPRTFAWAWTTLHAGYWQPLTWLSLLLDTRLFGYRAWGYHLTNLLLHTANVVLLFAVLRRLTGALWRSALVAALFAVHPLHVESVAWVTERKDVLSTLFWVLTLAAYARYAARPSLGRYALVLLTFVLGLLSKPMLVTLPCVLLLLDYWPLRRLRLASRGRERPEQARLPTPVAHAPGSPVLWLLLEKLPLLAVAAAASVLTVHAQKQAGAVVPAEVLPLPSRLATALVGYGEYLAKTVWPLNLSAFYPYRHYSLTSWQVIGSAALLGALTALAVWQVRRLPYLAVGWFWFVGTLLPVSGLFQAGMQALADRFSYVPHIGLFLAAVWGASDLATRWRCPVPVRAGAAAALLLALAAATWVQVGYWHDSGTLWEHALAVDPDNYFAQDYLGVFLFQKGDLERARLLFADSVRINPKNELAQYHLGVALLLDKQLPEAEQHLERARQLKPGNADVEHNLGLALLRQGKFTEAEQHFRAALEINPRSADTLDNLGLVLLRQGEREKAAECFRRALEIDPQNTAARNHLAVALDQGGK